ncbi:hypothetical protein KC349_g1976 [Hortaea werneckii]|nr:hypothetical protein KC349_g1976 [Hortaea werneckii]
MATDLHAEEVVSGKSVSSTAWPQKAPVRGLKQSGTKEISNEWCLFGRPSGAQEACCTVASRLPRSCQPLFTTGEKNGRHFLTLLHESEPACLCSESFRLCEEPGIEIGKTFKTAWVYTRWETDRMFDIVIRFRENFDLGSANVVQIDIRAGLGQTNHCFNDAAVFAIQTSWVKGQQHVISSFAAETYDSTCCPDLQANGAGEPIILSESHNIVGQGSSKNNYAFLIRPMEDELVWGEAEKGDWFDRDTTPGNITVYVTRGVVTWDQTDEVDSNPAEQRVCSPKSMKRFKAIPGQEGDPYIVEFRPLASSKRPVSWPETEDITDDNGRPKMPPGYKGGFVVQGDVDFAEARRRTQDIRRHMSSEWKDRKAVELQTLHGDGSDRRNTRSSSGGGQPATQSTIAQGDGIDEIQMKYAPQSGGSTQIETPSGERVPSTSATVQHPQVSEASDGSVQPTPSRAARFANGSDSSSVGASSVSIPQKRKGSSQHAKRRKSGSVEPRPSLMVELPDTGHSQSPKASSLQDGGETMSPGSSPGNQANERQETAVSDGQMGDNDEDSLDQIARDSSAQLPRDSSVQLAEDSPVQFAREKTFSRVSVDSSILSYENGPRVQDRANEPSTKRAAIAEMRSGVSNASSQIGFETHPTEGSNPREAAEPIQQTHMPLEHNPNEEVGAYTENRARRADTMLGLPTRSSYADHHAQGYPTSTLQQQPLPTAGQQNGITDGQFEQAHNDISLDRGQEHHGDHYATPASSDGHQHRKDSVVPDQRTSANTPAPSVESAGSSNKRPALQMGIVDLTNSDDDSPLPANNRPTIQTVTDSDEEDEEKLAEIQRKRQMLKKEMEDLVLQKQEDEVLKRMSRRARRAVKSEPSAIVKSEQ